MGSKGGSEAKQQCPTARTKNGRPQGRPAVRPRSARLKRARPKSGHVAGCHGELLAEGPRESDNGEGQQGEAKSPPTPRTTEEHQRKEGGAPASKLCPGENVHPGATKFRSPSRRSGACYGAKGANKSAEKNCPSSGVWGQPGSGAQKLPHPWLI